MSGGGRQSYLAVQPGTWCGRLLEGPVGTGHGPLSCKGEGMRQWLLAALVSVFTGAGLVGCGEEPVPAPAPKPKPPATSPAVDTAKKPAATASSTAVPVEKKTEKEETK